MNLLSRWFGEQPDSKPSPSTKKEAKVSARNQLVIFASYEHLGLTGPLNWHSIWFRIYHTQLSADQTFVEARIAVRGPQGHRAHFSRGYLAGNSHIFEAGLQARDEVLDLLQEELRNKYPGRLAAQAIFCHMREQNLRATIALDDFRRAQLKRLPGEMPVSRTKIEADRDVREEQAVRNSRAIDSTVDEVVRRVHARLIAFGWCEGIMLREELETAALIAHARYHRDTSWRELRHIVARMHGGQASAQMVDDELRTLREQRQSRTALTSLSMPNCSVFDPTFVGKT